MFSRYRIGFWAAPLVAIVAFAVVMTPACALAMSMEDCGGGMMPGTYCEKSAAAPRFASAPVTVELPQLTALTVASAPALADLAPLAFVPIPRALAPPGDDALSTTRIQV